MAVRIVNDTDGTMKKTAFIMGGQTPVGMALISLCLERNYNVYTTVPNEAAYQLVSLMFPQVRIFEFNYWREKVFDKHRNLKPPLLYSLSKPRKGNFSFMNSIWNFQ